MQVIQGNRCLTFTGLFRAQYKIICDMLFPAEGDPVQTGSGGSLSYIPQEDRSLAGQTDFSDLFNKGNGYSLARTESASRITLLLSTSTTPPPIINWLLVLFNL